MSKRIIIIGGPSAGKTTLAKALGKRGYTVVGADDYIGKATFESIPEMIMSDIEGMPGDLVIEGCQAARMVRKGCKYDTLVRMTHRSPNPRHASLYALSASIPLVEDHRFAIPFDVDVAVNEVLYDE